ncbi:MAG: pilus assembly protein [Thiohalocapsa sp.]|uniref:pilus assembly PilX family protein n=1 Tax=Thiohalocapsa sp. TaxID=2497641 RepID=UPI0025DCCB82|nr:PilX N-terminal domain-containing pilus assembly protein [Thiohalocapsa sp.]MCG6940544.1 pilus assembly protein [Thiohalocapsa sp.]
MHRHPRTPCPRRADQSGSALIIGLLLLFLMTLVSLVTTTETRTDARITSNELDRVIAFQAAEAALREAEARLMVPNPSEAMEGDIGFYDELSVPPDDYAAWDSTNSYEYSGDIPGILSPPRYVIDQLPGSPVNHGYLVIGEVYYGREEFLYRIIVTCTGRSGTSRVVIQSTFSPPEA